MMRRLRMVCASGCLTSSVRLSLERLVQTKWEASPRTLSSYPRAKSPAPGRSILITRAPRSASWRVANGAAIACSSDTTVTPFKVLMIGSSPQDRRRVHGQPSFMIARPKLHGVAIAGLAAYRKRFEIEQRPDRPELESRHVGLGHFAA